MSVAVQPRPNAKPAAAQPNRLLLTNVSWQTYRRLAALFPEHPLRLTYSEGVLEIMTLSPRHENFKSILRLLIDMVLLECRIRSRRFGSMTCSREDLEKGLEPDETYWIQSVDRLRSNLEVDLNIDPPPDLVAEIEVSRRLKERWDIYVAMRVPEVWSWDGDEVIFHVLKGKKYQVVKRSRAFPFLTSADVTRFAHQMRDEDELAGLTAFQNWLRQRATQV